MGGVLRNSPQWRKYISEVLNAGIEVIDMYPIFIEKRKCERLFSKYHHISAIGADIVGNAVARYLKETTIGISNIFDIHRELNLIYSSDYGDPDNVRELAYTHYITQQDEEVGHFKVFIPQRVYYWNQRTKESNIVIFGDCNLQSYNSIGAGISSNLTYHLRYPVCNAGRRLIFGFEEKPLHKDELIELLKYDIIIYVAFASAPFVRSSQLSLKRPRLEYKWQHFALD